MQPIENIPETWFFIDFENLPSVLKDPTHSDSFRIFVFVGSHQTKISFDIVQAAHQFGNRLEWVKIEGAGKNNLDFHLAYHLGKYNENAAKDVRFVILSKDTGFDALIKFVNSTGRVCRRLEKLDSLPEKRTPPPPKSIEEILPEMGDAKTDIAKIVQNISKIKVNKRPRKVRTLKNHLESIITKAGAHLNIDEIFEALIQQDVIAVDGTNVVYKVRGIQPADQSSEQ
jgi:hypothetical protein